MRRLNSNLAAGNYGSGDNAFVGPNSQEADASYRSHLERRKWKPDIRANNQSVRWRFCLVTAKGKDLTARLFQTALIFKTGSMAQQVELEERNAAIDKRASEQIAEQAQRRAADGVSSWRNERATDLWRELLQDMQVVCEKITQIWCLNKQQFRKRLSAKRDAIQAWSARARLRDKLLRVFRTPEGINSWRLSLHIISAVIPTSEIGLPKTPTTHVLIRWRKIR